MKKLVFILAGILLLSFSSNAQKGKELIIGVGGSLSSVWIQNQNFYGEPEIEYAAKMGYAGSFNLGYNFTENISVITELQYSLQGQKYDGKQNFNGNNYDVTRDISLTYFNVPLFFKYAFGTADTKFRFMIGPQIGILMDATQEYLRDGERIQTVIETNDFEFVTDEPDIKDRFESNDIGLAFDVGADIHVSDQFYISPGFRINYGFNDINAETFRLNDIDGEYTPSHNFVGGLYISINYKIDVEGYSQRSF